MKRFLLLVALSVLLAGCGEAVAPVATPSSPVAAHKLTPSPAVTYATPLKVTHVPTDTPVPLKLTQAPTATSPWHVVQHFTSTVDFFGSPQYNPDRSEQVTVTNPWRIAWQAHLDSKDDDGFSLFVCQNESVGIGSIPECTALVYLRSGSGITALITKVYGDVSLDMSIGGLNSTWSIDIEEEPS